MKTFSFSQEIITIVQISTTVSYFADPCLKCNDYDQAGYGYLKDSNDCGKYFICKVDKSGVSETLYHMSCPAGTMYNKLRANLGVPCVHISSDSDCINDEGDLVSGEEKLTE